MAKTTKIKTDAGDIELRRPTFSEMRELGDKAQELFEAESAQALLFSDTFDQLMARVAVSEADYERLVNECDIVDVWNVWQSYAEFARFRSFFEEAEATQAELRIAVEEVQYGAAGRRLEVLKKLGIAPEDYSMADVLKSAGQEDLAAAMSKAPEASETGSAKPRKKGDAKK